MCISSLGASAHLFGGSLLLQQEELDFQSKPKNKPHPDNAFRRGPYVSTSPGACATSASLVSPIYVSNQQTCCQPGWGSVL